MAAAGNREAKSQLWAQLMVRAQKGDKEAFQQLLADVGPLITRFVTRRIHEQNEVEDVCQEILLALCKSRHTFQPARPLEPWLFSIAHNVCADHNHRQWSRLSKQKFVDDMPEDAAEGEASGALDLRLALDGLPRPQLEALRLIKVEGLSLAQASELTGDSVGSLKVRVHRAYAFLKKAVSR